MVGDAIIAHELAHVVQQGGSASAVAPMSIGGAGYSALEEDADMSAVGAVASLWGGAKGRLKDIARNAGPRLRSGLRLQRCPGNKKEEVPKETPTPTPPPAKDGCITGNLTAKTSGTLQGGWSVNDYLTGGLSWGAVGSPTTAGVDGKGVKVQMVGPFSGKENLGVSQTIQLSGANQAFLDTLAAYTGQAPGSVKNGDVVNEPVLDASDPFAARGWILRYKDGMASFADVPRNGAGSKGSVNFVTCFHSKATDCENVKCCVTWKWTIDFTTGNNVNTVGQESQNCTKK